MWHISDNVRTEIFLQSTLQNSGVAKTKFLEKYEKNFQGLKNSSKYNSIFVSLFLLFPVYLLITTIEKSISIYSIDLNYHKIIFTTSFTIGTYYIFNLVFILIFGLFQIRNLLEGKVFRYLQTLPFSTSDLKIIGLFTYIRLLFFQLIVMIFAFPVGIYIITNSILLSSIVLLLNLINILIISYTLIIIVNFLSNKLFKEGETSILSKIFRYVFVSIFIIISFSIYYLIDELSALVLQLYELNTISENLLSVINLIFSIIGFPFASGYIISLFIFRDIQDVSLILTTIIGGVILMVIFFIIVSKGNHILLNLAIDKEKYSKNEVQQDTVVSVEMRTPRIAYLLLSLKIVGRDMSSSIRLIMALLIPLIPIIQDTETDPFISYIFYTGFIMFLLDNAFSSSEEALGGIITSLPLKTRDIFRVKHLLIGSAYFLSFLLQTLITSGAYLNYSRIFLVLFLILIIPNMYLLLKSIIFGKINNRYTLFTTEDNTNFLKLMIIIIPLLLFIGIDWGLLTGLTKILSSDLILPIFTSFNLLVLIVLEGINRLIFK